jgi:hypothetical protein
MLKPLRLACSSWQNDVDPSAVLLHIVRFFFKDLILERIASATNGHARQLVVGVCAHAKQRASHPRARHR